MNSPFIQRLLTRHTPAENRAGSGVRANETNSSAHSLGSLVALVQPRPRSRFEEATGFADCGAESEASSNSASAGGPPTPLSARLRNLPEQTEPRVSQPTDPGASRSPQPDKRNTNGGRGQQETDTPHPTANRRPLVVEGSEVKTLPQISNRDQVSTPDERHQTGGAEGPRQGSGLVAEVVLPKPVMSSNIKPSVAASPDISSPPKAGFDQLRLPQPGAAALSIRMEELHKLLRTSKAISNEPAAPGLNQRPRPDPAAGVSPNRRQQPDKQSPPGALANTTLGDADTTPQQEPAQPRPRSQPAPEKRLDDNEFRKTAAKDSAFWLAELQTDLQQRVRSAPQSPPEKVVQVSIGRIEIRTQANPPSKGKTPQVKKQGVMSLDDYLKHREQH